MVAASGLMTVTGALGFARFGYTMILPAMQEGLRLTSSEMGLLASGNLAGYLTFTLIAGLLSSRYGPRIVVALSMTLTSITMALTGASNSFQTALAMRTLTGIGSGGSNVPAMSLTASWFAPRKRGTAAGVMAAGSGVGLIITGLLVPGVRLVYGLMGWRYAWYLLGLITLVVACLGYILIRNRPAEKGLCAVGEVPPRYTPNPSPAEPLRLGLLFKNRSILHLGLTYFMFGFSYIIYVTFFAAYLEGEVGLDPTVAGGLWMLAGALSILSGFVWGVFSDRVGRRYALATTYLLLAASFFIFANLRTMTGFYSSAVLFGVTAWSVPTIMAAAAGDYVGPKLAPAALAIITTFFFGTGQAVAPYIAGYLKDVVGSFTVAFTLSTFVSIAGMVLSLCLRKQPDGCLSNSENGVHFQEYGSPDT